MTSMWHERWANKRTGWDLGGPHPLTREIFELARAIDATVVTGHWLIPGCGRAHDGPLLLELGARCVTGKDLVETAIDEAKSLHQGVRNLHLTSGDIFDVGKLDEAGFDAVFDRAMMCALNGEDRVRYIDAVHKLLKPRGLFVSIAFAQTSEPESGPPFQVTESELRANFKKGWEIIHLEGSRGGACDQKILSEWIFIARRV